MIKLIERRAVMASTPPKKPALKGKQSPTAETQRSIEEQTAAFLKCGGQIQRIPNGVTGQTNLAGPRQISLAKKPGDAAPAANPQQKR
jgi:hypothetical protein